MNPDKPQYSDKIIGGKAILIKGLSITVVRNTKKQSKNTV
ncbi:hypothetical protein NIES23_50510 [Trichormus variabilis NIES-23]|uniref:Uncharacterized protein n=1 Tax=Trichormus variabilis NIES-23 TaxID=1973479 RepID=A0A1Z4KTE0_ANAVA|nr:hypothetical protein NIES23_50510 [Trichormus variabilis NIES-23]